MTLAQIRRGAIFLVAPLLCLILFRRVLSTWFLIDDFAWLGLPLEVSRPRDLWPALFTPAAQGTVRVFSERLFFLVFSWLFGLNALPFRLWILGTWFADLTLATIIGARITGSRVAGMLAAVLWTTSVRMLTPLAWASAYNEVLCAFFVLAAFYSRLRWLESRQRKWMVAEWVAYLAGFGALEVIVMYPALVVLYSLCTHTRNWVRSTVPLFAPSILFTVVHFLFIPQTPGPYYTMVVDSRLTATFVRYLTWAISPSQLVWRDDLMVTGAIGLGLAAFAIARTLKKDFRGLFCCGWFVLLIAPMLPLPNHITEYYLTLPMAGLAWLGGWAVVTAWRTGRMGQAVAVVLISIYLVGSGREIGYGTRWYQDRTDRMRVLLLGVKQAAAVHPGTAILLDGVDQNLYDSGFVDDPFRLFGVNKIYLAGGGQGIQGRADTGGTTRFVIPVERELGLIETSGARVLHVSRQEVTDITSAYESKLRANQVAVGHDFVDVGDASYESSIGPTWYPIENGFRWMPRTGTVKLSVPDQPAGKLVVKGYAPAALLATGPVVLRFRVRGRDVGTGVVRAPEAFSMEFPLMPGIVGKGTVDVSVEANKVFRPPGEQRDLGMIFGTFEIR